MRALFGSLRGRRTILATLGLVAGLVGGYLMTAVDKAEAISGPAICTYYNNAAHKKVVGARGTGCCGAPISWGTTTIYFQCEQLLCPDVVCPT